MPTELQALAKDAPILRQRERTVDNVKRLYAFILSLSFANLVKEMVDTAGDAVLRNPGAKHPGFTHLMIFDIMLLGVFLFTTAVYYFHSDKFLDIRYATPVPGYRGPDDAPVVVVKWNSRQFAWDYITLIVTMIPFAVMSFTLDKGLVGRFGIMPFYAAYILLLQLSAFVIVLGWVWRLCRPDPGTLEAGIVRDAGFVSEAQRYAALGAHWIVIDTVAVIALQALFRSDAKGGALCGHIPMTDGATHFLFWFLVVATARNLLDYFTVWPFLYLSDIAEPKVARRLMIWVLFDGNLTPRARIRRWVNWAILGLFVFSMIMTWTQLYHPFLTILANCPVVP